MNSKNERKIMLKKQIDEIKKLLQKCSNCGYCKNICPVFKATLREDQSSRSRVLQLSEGIVIPEAVFLCTGCRACEQRCPNNIKIFDAILLARQYLSLSGKQLDSNEEMKRNIEKFGNPFGDIGEEVPDKFYCC